MKQKTKSFVTGIAIIIAAFAPGFISDEYMRVVKNFAAVIGYLAFGYHLGKFTDWLYEDSSIK